MEENTFTDPRVSRLINEFAIPVQFNVVEDVGAKRRFNSFWTPCSMLRSVEDVEFRRSYGALTPDVFIAEYSLARGLSYLHSGQLKNALDLITDALNSTEKVPTIHAENLYWMAVAKYRQTDDPQELENGWEILRKEHPDTDWSKKTDFFFQS